MPEPLKVLNRRSMRRRAAACAGSLGVLALVAACGGSDVKCGAGTTKQGNTCVASSPVEQQPEAGTTTDAGTSGSGGAPSVDSGGGSGGSAVDGGASGGASAGGAPSTDAGDQTIHFAGVASADPADQTPPGGAGNALPGLIRLSWLPATFPAHPEALIHYEIFEADAKGKENFSAPTESAPPGATSFVLQDRQSKTFFYVVRAVANVGTEKDENTVEVSTKAAYDDTPPDFAGGATSATPAGPTSVKVSWSAATDDLTQPDGITYRVRWTDKIGGTLSLGAISLPGATSAIVTGLPAAVSQYYFQVNAVDAAGNVDTNTVQIAGKTGPDTTAPTFGGCTAVTDISAATAQVTWAPATDDTSPASKITYTVYATDVSIKRGDSLTGLEVGTFTGTTTGKVTGLNSATFYRFICRASDEAGNQDDNLVIQTGSTSTDGDPPTFKGITKAEPSNGSTEAAIDLTWQAASDLQSPPENIVYAVYAATKAGGELFTGAPTVISLPGATGITVSNSKLLPVVNADDPTATSASNRDFFFVVRARDEAGNEDQNLVELDATTFVSFANDIQPIFNNKCALLGCHTAQDPAQPPKQGQNLDEGSAYDSIVNVTSVEGQALGETNLKRVNTDGVLMDSYMWRKITNGGPIIGSTMPPATAPNGPLDDTPGGQKDTLILWFKQGARKN